MPFNLSVVAETLTYVGNVEHVNNFIFIIIKGWNIFFSLCTILFIGFLSKQLLSYVFLKAFFSKYLFLRGLLKDVDNNDIYLNVKLLNIPKYPFQSASGWDERQN